MSASTRTKMSFFSSLFIVFRDENCTFLRYNVLSAYDITELHYQPFAYCVPSTRLPLHLDYCVTKGGVNLMYVGMYSMLYSLKPSQFMDSDPWRIKGMGRKWQRIYV